MIRRLYRLWPDPRLLARLWILTGVQAVLQGLLLGALVPVLLSLLQPDPDLAGAAPWLIAGAIGALAYMVLTVVAVPIGFAAAGQLAVELRRRLMRHASTLPLGWFTTHHKTRLARGVTADVGDAAQLAVVIGHPVITASLLPTTIVVIMFALDPRVALLLCVVALAAALTLRSAARVAAEAETELERASTEVAARAIELGQAQPVLRAAGLAAGTPQMKAALSEHHQTYRAGMDRARRPFLLYTAVIASGFAGALGLVSMLLLTGQIGVGEAVALLVLATRFLQPLGQLIDLIGALRAMSNKITRLEELLATPALTVPTDPVDPPVEPVVELSEVDFSYPGTKTPALEAVSLTCTAGSVTALVGPSGSGKTTATRLIARFFDPDRGTIRIGGADVRDLEPSVLMNLISIVFQDVYLFDDTLEANLLLARPDATPEELAAAARTARVEEVIARLPHGWQSTVGEGGTRLSGGERQRVAIARAVLKRSRIVLIDEATSALDPENEAAIANAITELGADPSRVVIVIAHRPATLAGADHVVALEQGRVVETGSPSRLVQAGGVFARIMRQQQRSRSWQITDRHHTTPTTPNEGNR